MKRILAIVLCVILCLCATACTATPTNVQISEDDTATIAGRLVELYDSHPEPVHIYVDTETGVMYMIYEHAHGVAIQVMLDTQGCPAVWRDKK